MLITQQTSRKSALDSRGFGLVELMVALVVGLIVSGAVLALVVAMMKSSRQTVQTTRLNQELRATLAVIASDLRRARGVEDPLSAAVVTVGNAYKAVDTATPNCIRYGYFDKVDDDGDGDSDNDNFHVIHLWAPGRIRRASANTAAAATCALAGQPLGSDQVEIIDFIVEPVPDLSADINRHFKLTITGRLIDQDAELNVTRTMSQDVYIPSVGTGI